MSTHQHIYLRDNERTELEQLIKSGTHSARVISRARTLLLLDRRQGETRTIAQVMDAAMVSQGTVSNLKKRYFTGGLERALYDLPRPGAKPKIDGEVEKPFTIAFDDLLKKVQLEERVYRHLCVEAWSMVVPWSGFTLRQLVELGARERGES